MIQRAPLFSAVMASLLALSAGSAFAQGKKAPKAPKDQVHTVRYSYELSTRSGQKQYVLVPQPTKIPTGTLQERSRALFKKLVGAKRASYGDARLAFQPDAAKTGVVYVYVDAKKAAYAPIVMAETVYTFTENGASAVLFPKSAFKGPQIRADVKFPAYVMALPLWQALPPRTIKGALALMPGGSLLPVEVALKRIKDGDKPTIEALWSYVEKGPPAATKSTLLAAPLLGLTDLQDRLLPVLNSADPAIRALVLDGLAGLDNKTVNTALRGIMDADRDSKLRDKAAGILSKSKDLAFSTAAQYHALRSDDLKIVAAAATALGNSKQPEAGKQLLNIVLHADAAVRAAAIASLIKRADQSALVKRMMANGTHADARLQMAQALAKGKEPKSQYIAWQFLVGAGPLDDALVAAKALASIDKGPTYKALGVALKHTEPAARIAATEALSTLGKAKGLKLLAQVDAADADSGEAVLAAMRGIYEKQPLDFVLKGARSKKNPTLKRCAVATLGAMVATKEGKRYRKTIAETLQSLAGSPDAEIRAAAARSFELMPGKDVRGDLMKLSTDSDLAVKRAVARALRAYPGPDSLTKLLAYAEERDPVLLANAIGTLGILGEAEGRDVVIKRLGHDDPRVRRAATTALVALGAKMEKRKPLLSYFSERVFDKDSLVRMAAIKGLGLVKDPRTVTAMAALLQDPVVAVRKATLLAMADTGDTSAVEAIVSGLEDEDLGVRDAAVTALGNLKHKEAKAALLKFSGTEKDKTVAAHAKQVAGQL